MDNQNQQWGGVNYSDSAVLRLGSLAKRLANALERSVVNPDTAWSVACLELAVEIEKMRNPSRVAFNDQRRRRAGIRGFDKLAAIEEVYAAHDELLRVSEWQSLAVNQDEEGTDARITITPKIISRLRNAAEAIDQTQAADNADVVHGTPNDDSNPWSELLQAKQVATTLKVSRNTITRWCDPKSNGPYEVRKVGTRFQYRRSRRQ